MGGATRRWVGPVAGGCGYKEAVGAVMGGGATAGE